MAKNLIENLLVIWIFFDLIFIKCLEKYCFLQQKNAVYFEI